MDNAVVYGFGIVGKATAYAFGIKKIFDKDEKKRTVDLPEAARERYHFICLPTPTKNGKCQTDDIVELCQHIDQLGKGQHVFVIRSTVYVGFNRFLANCLGHHGVVSNPEFLTEATWKEDADQPDIIVIGGDQKNYVEDIVGIYKARYRFLSPIIATDSITAETIKYAVNSFYALKVVFANELYDFCHRFGISYPTIKEALYQRKWIGKNHLEIWYRGERGLKGRCLPKDLEAFAEQSQIQLLKLAHKINVGGFGKS